MNVRELIISLLEFELDAEVEASVETNEGSDYCDFDLENQYIGGMKNYASLIVKPEGKVLVDEQDYESLKDENSHYENRVAELENANDEYERHIEVLESGE